MSHGQARTQICTLFAHFLCLFLREICGMDQICEIHMVSLFVATECISKLCQILYKLTRQEKDTWVVDK